MDKFLNKNIFQELISNLYRVPFLDIAAIYILILFAFVVTLLFIQTFSSWKIKANILRLTKIIHLLSIIWIAISLFMMKAFNSKLSKSLNFVFRLKFAVVLILAIVILVFFAEFLDLIFDDLQPNKPSDYKFFLVRAFLITYLNYAFMFMAAEKSTILLILGPIILFPMNKILQTGLNNAKLKYTDLTSGCYYTNEIFKQLIGMKKSLHSNFGLLFSSMESIAENNGIADTDIKISDIDFVKQPDERISFYGKDYEFPTLALSKIKASSFDTLNQKLDEIEKFLYSNLRNYFYYSKACLKELINKQLELYESLLTRKFDARLNEESVKNYKEQIEGEKKKLKEFFALLHNFTMKDYPKMNEIFMKKLQDSLKEVGTLSHKLL